MPLPTDTDRLNRAMVNWIIAGIERAEDYANERTGE